MSEIADTHSDRVYYYPLYHALGHMAAYVAILVLLITMGLVLSTSQAAVTGILRRSAVIAVLCALVIAEIYSVLRMVGLANFVFQELPEGARRTVLLLPHPQNQWLPAVAALFI